MLRGSWVGIVTNWCTGVEGDPATLQEIKAALAENKEKSLEHF